MVLGHVCEHVHGHVCENVHGHECGQGWTCALVARKTSRAASSVALPHWFLIFVHLFLLRPVLVFTCAYSFYRGLSAVLTGTCVFYRCVQFLPETVASFTGTFGFMCTCNFYQGLSLVFICTCGHYWQLYF